MRPQGEVYGHDEVLKGVTLEIDDLEASRGVYGHDEVLKGLTLKIR